MKSTLQCANSVRFVRATVVLIAIAGVWGCGGGSSTGSSVTTTTGPGGGGTQTATTTVSGSVTDVQGSPFVTATVTVGQETATTSQAGDYQIANVPVPSNSLTVVDRVAAAATVAGRAYSGSNTVTLLSGETNVSNVQITMSPANWQGSISGKVTDSQGNPIVSARISASAPAASSQTYFTNLGSFLAVTDANGAYNIPNVPPLGVSLVGNPPVAGVAGTPYTVTASAVGHLNQTLSVAVTSGAAASAAFSLATSTTSDALPSVANFAAQIVTTPTTATRSERAALPSGALNAVRRFILAKRGLLAFRRASTSSIRRAPSASRGSPAGSAIEADLFWDYQIYGNLLGYDILRSVASGNNFQSIALLYDPLADRYSDLDPNLTPGTTYYYSVARDDTINYPVNGDEGTPSAVAAVQPLQPIALGAPASGSSQGQTPTLSWVAVSNAATYQVLVYSQFPNYQSDTDPDGVPPIWPSDATNPGSSQVTGTSTTYAGPTLQHGRTYYWAVIAIDATGSAYSISQISSFAVP